MYSLRYLLVKWSGQKVGVVSSSCFHYLCTLLQDVLLLSDPVPGYLLNNLVLLPYFFFDNQ